MELFFLGHLQGAEGTGCRKTSSQVACYYERRNCLIILNIYITKLRLIDGFQAVSTGA